jgi:hypothetical protein
MVKPKKIFVLESLFGGRYFRQKQNNTHLDFFAHFIYLVAGALDQPKAEKN